MTKVPCVTLSANSSWYLFNFRRSTILSLLGSGFRVICFSPPDEFTKKLISLGCDWCPLSMRPSSVNPFFDILVFFRFVIFYFKFRPVLAFHFTLKNNLYGTVAARIFGVPSANNISGLGTAFIRSGIIPRFVRLAYRLSQPLAFRVFCQNAEDYEVLVSQKLVPASRLFLLPGSGVDLEKFNPRFRAPRDGRNPFTLLFAGRMLADKGVCELVEAVSLINADGLRIKLELVGFAGSDNVSSISSEVLRDWGKLPGIYWRGPSEDMVDTYSKVDGVVLPSYREGMSRFLLEAAAMGLPLVATDVPGCRHIVTHGVNGFLCKAMDVSSLRVVLERLVSLSDSDLAAMGEFSRARVVAEFDEGLVVRAALKAVGDAQETCRGSKAG